LIYICINDNKNYTLQKAGRVPPFFIINNGINSLLDNTRVITFKRFIQEKALVATVYPDLKHNDLTKRGGGRLQIFMDKIKDGEKFLTKKGAAIINKSELQKLKSGFSQTRYNTTLKANIKQSPITLNYPKDFYKTPEFGGKGKGFGTRAEDRALSNLRNQIEAAMVNEKSGVLHMKIGGKKVIVTGVASTPSNPKSDFHLLDDKGKEVAWISHKDGSKAKDFQQYGGVTNKVFRASADLEKYLKDVVKASGGALSRGQSFMRVAKDEDVIKKSVWGIDYGKSERGRNNVDEFHQGPMTLSKVGNHYVIKSNHSDINGGIPSGEYKAVYYTRFTSDRGNLGIDNARTMVTAIGQMAKTVKEI